MDIRRNQRKADSERHVDVWFGKFWMEVSEVVKQPLAEEVPFIGSLEWSILDVRGNSGRDQVEERHPHIQPPNLLVD